MSSAVRRFFLPLWPRVRPRSAPIPQVATDHEPAIAPDCSAMRRMLGSNISASGSTRRRPTRSRALHPLPAAKWLFIPVPTLPSKGREPAKRVCPPNARGHGLASPEGRQFTLPRVNLITSYIPELHKSACAQSFTLVPPIRRQDASRIRVWSRLRENATKPCYYRVVIL